ncbi:MarR family winged helix-turn-helix transcriptional regulator [Microbacterium sp. CCNWLW134]|uniref:MarR family winged helix-turn-helix transcriptional regulator n=1 Tax=Microbacterium sp. CCNWLW134 TaxID=3122064 RepID=UPI0030105194
MVTDAAQLWKLNHRLLTLVLNACSGRFAELGIEPKEFFVLAEVATSPYPAELASALATPKASVTVYVRNLVAKGLITREIDAGDLRRHRLLLTPAGEATRDQASEALAMEFETRLGVLSTAQRDQLESLLQLVLSPESGAAP